MRLVDLVYGLILSISILFSCLVAEHLVKKGKESVDTFWTLVLITLVGGILGARVYHVIDLWAYYSKNPTEIINIANGGLAIMGAIIGGLGTLYIYLSLKRLHKTYWLNLAATVTPLAQSLGRWANFANHELFGKNGQPLFLYESVMDILLFVILIRTYQTQKNLWLYLLGYGVIRFTLEFFRPNPWILYPVGLPTAQIVSILFIVTAYANLYRLRSRRL